MFVQASDEDEDGVDEWCCKTLDLVALSGVGIFVLFERDCE